MKASLNNYAEIKTKISQKFNIMCANLDERATRLWVATEALAYGYGGIKLVYDATGISCTRIRRGIKECVAIAKNATVDTSLATKKRIIRRSGGGRKSIKVKHPEIEQKLDELIEPATRGDPENQLRWSSKSTVKLAKELSRLGYSIDQKTVYNLLDKQKYSMKSNRKSQEGKASHPDRDAQFNFY